MAAALIQNLKQELLKIKTIELTTGASRVIEKLFWMTIAISGTFWFLYFMSFQFKLWNDNSTFRTDANLNLSDIGHPAVTFCSKTTNKYGIVERFGNYLDSNVKLDHEFFTWLQNFITSCTIDHHVSYLKQLVEYDFLTEKWVSE